MARPREFDTDEVLDRVTGVFWQHGYEGTSLRDLMEATGLQKGSLYQAFGDKHTLFVTVLRRYLDRMKTAAARTLGALPPEEALPAWFAAMNEAKGGLRGCDGFRGCFAWTSASELAAEDPEVAGLLADHFRDTHRYLSGILAQGQESGVFRDDTAPGDLATYLLTAGAGLMAMSRAGFADEEDTSIQGIILSGLTPAAIK